MLQCTIGFCFRRRWLRDRLRSRLSGERHVQAGHDFRHPIVGHLGQIVAILAAQGAVGFRPGFNNKE